MPSKKGTLAYLARAARVKGKRSIQTLAKIAANKSIPKNQRMAAKSTEEKIKSAIQASYMGRKPLSGKQKRAIEMSVAQIESLVSGVKITRGKQGAANFATQFQLNLATRRYTGPEAAQERAANPSIYSREEVKTFYRVTQKIWQNKDGTPTDTSEINKRIMRYFKTTSLQTAFERAMSQPSVKTALQIADYTIDQNAQLTTEQQRYYDRAEATDNEQDKQSSPDYLTFVVQFDPDKPWSEQIE